METIDVSAVGAGGKVAPDPATAPPTVDPMLAALTAALDGSQPLDPVAMLKAQVEAQGDPRASLLMRYLDQQQQQAKALESQLQDAELDAEDSLPADSSPETTEDIRSVQQAVDELYAELGLLRARSAALAAAAGACRVCFGENPLCEQCNGFGVPGSRRPEPRAFRKYVLPAYRRARAVDNQTANER